MPKNVAITDYYESDREPKLTWRAATSDSGVDGYRIYQVEGATATVIGTVSTNTRAFSKIAEVVDLQDNSTYVFGVAAYNAFGESEIVTVTLETTVPEHPDLVVTSVSDSLDDTGSLRYLLSIAEDGDKIVFDRSLKGSTITLSGKQLDIAKSITIDASKVWDAATETPGITIDGNKKSRVFYAAEVEFSLVGLTIANGKASDFGGGVYIDGRASFGTFENCVFTGNAATTRGGGVYVYKGDSKFDNCVISGNTSTSNGGGVYFYKCDSELNDCKIVGNTANTGGGAYLYESSSADSFINCEISGNSAKSNGGGVVVYNGAVGTFSNCSVKDNSAVARGGGVYVYGTDSVAEFTACAIAGNTARDYGGGADIVGGASGAFTNSLIVENVVTGATGRGGGASVAGTGDFTNCTISMNSASGSSGRGDGVFISTGTSTFYNSIIVLNDSDDVYRSGGTVAGYNSLSTFASWTTKESVYAYDSAVPLFVDAENGDYQLATRSQAINMGNNDYVQTEFDFSGEERVVFDVVDLGAYEFQKASQVALDSPTITETSATASTITVEWSEVEGATGYRITCGDNVQTVDAETLTHTVTGLDQNTDYTVQVAALGDGMSTIDSPDSEAIAKTKTLVQLARPALTATATTVDSITVEWKAIENASGYILSYAVKASKPVYTEVAIDADATSYTISELNAAANYYVKIKAIGDGLYYKDSAQSPTATVKTATPVPVQLARPALAAAETAPSSITVEWKAIENASGYILSYAVKAAAPVYTEVPVDANATSYTISGLNASTNYYVKIKAKGDGLFYKDSAQSPTITAKTAAPAPVQLARPALTATATTEDSITVEWKAIENASGYILSYAVKAAAPVYTEVPIDANATSYTISGLNASTNYYVKIKAKGDGVRYKDSAQSPTITAKTAVAAVQLAQPVLTTTATTDSTIAVQWDAIPNASGYTLSFALSASSPVYTDIAIAADATSYTISGLKASTSYNVTLRANGDGVQYKDSAQSPTITARTLAAATNALDVADYAVVLQSNEDDYAFDATLAELADDAFEELFEEAFDELEIDLV